MSTSAALADSRLRRAFGRRVRPSGPAAPPTRRRPQTWFDFIVEPRTSPRDSAVSKEGVTTKTGQRLSATRVAVSRGITPGHLGFLARGQLS